MTISYYSNEAIHIKGTILLCGDYFMMVIIILSDWLSSKVNMAASKYKC